MREESKCDVYRADDFVYVAAGDGETGRGIKMAAGLCCATGDSHANAPQQINRIDAEVKLIEEEKMEGYEKYRRKEILVDEYRKFMELLRGKEEKLTVEKGRLEGRLEKYKK